MHRFFVSPECISGDTVTLGGAVARQLAHVLRSRPGDRIVVLDDSGWEYLVSLDEVNPRTVRGVVTARASAMGEPRTRITLYQGTLKSDTFELVLQKCTELGVSAFVPTICARSVARDKDEGWAKKRYPRWHRIIAEAAEQSHRGRLPTLADSLSYFDACDQIDGPAVIPWEEEKERGLRAALASTEHHLDDASAVGVFIGPEGGFTAEEIDYARGKGIVPVSLGNRVLRAETAGIAAIAAILYELGELGD